MSYNPILTAETLSLTVYFGHEIFMVRSCAERIKKNWETHPYPVYVSQLDYSRLNPYQNTLSLSTSNEQVTFSRKLRTNT